MLTDPRDPTPRAHRTVHRCRQCGKLVTHDGHQFTTLTVHPSRPETISRSRDMDDAHQNLTGLRDPTTLLSGIICHPWASTCYPQHVYQI